METIKRTLDKVNANLDELKNKEKEESGEINVKIVVSDISDEEREKKEEEELEYIRNFLKKNGAKV